jgi:prevent-host-death family protein
MIMVNTHDAKSRLSSLLAAVEQGNERVMICRNGKPIAELRAVARHADRMKKNRRLGPIEFRESPVAPLKSSDWPDAELPDAPA